MNEYTMYTRNRTLCDVLNEIRELDKTKNYAPLLSLVEEAQIMGNRMEAGLHDKQDYNSLKERIKKAKAKLKKLGKKITKLEGPENDN